LAGAETCHPGFPATRRQNRGKCGEAKTRRKRKMKYAIIESGGKQYRAVEGSMIDVDLLHVTPGTEVTLEQVLLVAEGDNVAVGTPNVKGAAVKATVVAHVKGEKTFNFTYSPKKRIRQKTGHRQQYTRLEIQKIEK
jgi:large subunit ribosomal protein L21